MAEKKGLLLCVCLGSCPSFGKMDIFEILNRARKEKLIDWVGIHPQLCADDGDEYLKTLLSGTKVDSLYVAGCDPTMQRKMFRDAFEASGFPRENHIGIEIRNLDTDGAYNVIKEAITGGNNGKIAY